MGIVFDVGLGGEDHRGAGLEVVLGPGWEGGCVGVVALDEACPGPVHLAGKGRGGGVGGFDGVGLLPDEAEIGGVVGLASLGVGGFGVVEAVHPGRAVGLGLGFSHADAGDPVLFGGDGADAALLGGHVGVEGFVFGEDLLEGFEVEVAEVAAGGVGGGMGTDEEGALVAVGADEEAFVLEGAGGDEVYGALGKEGGAYFGAEGEVAVGGGDEGSLRLEEISGRCGEEVVEGGGGLCSAPEVAVLVGYGGGLSEGVDAFAAAALGDG